MCLYIYMYIERERLHTCYMFVIRWLSSSSGCCATKICLLYLWSGKPLRPRRSVSRIRVVRSSDPTGIQVRSEILDPGSCCFYTRCLGAQADEKNDVLTEVPNTSPETCEVITCCDYRNTLPLAPSIFRFIFSSSCRSWHWHKVYSWKNIRCKHVQCLYRPAGRGHVDNPSGK